MVLGTRIISPLVRHCSSFGETSEWLTMLNILIHRGSSFYLGSYYSDPGIRRLIVERQAAPDILLSGLITNDDVVKLFDM